MEKTGKESEVQKRKQGLVGVRLADGAGLALNKLEKAETEQLPKGCHNGAAAEG